MECRRDPPWKSFAYLFISETGQILCSGMRFVCLFLSLSLSLTFSPSLCFEMMFRNVQTHPVWTLGMQLWTCISKSRGNSFLKWFFHVSQTSYLLRAKFSVSWRSSVVSWKHKKIDIKNISFELRQPFLQLFIVRRSLKTLVTGKGSITAYHINPNNVWPLAWNCFRGGIWTKCTRSRTACGLLVLAPFLRFYQMHTIER